MAFANGCGMIITGTWGGIAEPVATIVRPEGVFTASLVSGRKMHYSASGICVILHRRLAYADKRRLPNSKKARAASTVTEKRSARRRIDRDDLAAKRCLNSCGSIIDEPKPAVISGAGRAISEERGYDVCQRSARRTTSISVLPEICRAVTATFSCAYSCEWAIQSSGVCVTHDGRAAETGLSAMWSADRR